MLDFLLKCNKFKLVLSIDTFDNDIKYPINTIMNVFYKDENFSAKASLDIDVNDFVFFIKKLSDVYNKLSGEAIIEEPYSYKRFISFIADKNGYIKIKGYLCDDFKNNELNFENIIDQTYLKSFIDELVSKYLRN